MKALDREILYWKYLYLRVDLVVVTHLLEIPETPVLKPEPAEAVFRDQV